MISSFRTEHSPVRVKYSFDPRDLRSLRSCAPCLYCYTSWSTSHGLSLKFLGNSSSRLERPWHVRETCNDFLIWESISSSNARKVFPDQNSMIPTRGQLLKKAKAAPLQERAESVIHLRRKGKTVVLTREGVSRSGNAKSQQSWRLTGLEAPNLAPALLVPPGHLSPAGSSLSTRGTPCHHESARRHAASWLESVFSEASSRGKLHASSSMGPMECLMNKRKRLEDQPILVV